MKRAIRGFTIVELLIVIVVIAILAAISIVAYNGIQKRAHNADAVSTLKNAQKLIKMYKINEGTYPPTNPADRGYCIGTNYPNNRCRDSYSGPVYSYPVSNTVFTDELNKAGSISDNEKRLVHGTVGPYIQVNDADGFTLVGVFYGEECPSQYATSWNDSSSDRILCSQYYSYSD